VVMLTLNEMYRDVPPHGLLGQVIGCGIWFDRFLCDCHCIDVGVYFSRRVIRAFATKSISHHFVPETGRVNITAAEIVQTLIKCCNVIGVVDVKWLDLGDLFQYRGDLLLGCQLLHPVKPVLVTGFSANAFAAWDVGEVGAGILLDDQKPQCAAPGMAGQEYFVLPKTFS
jgi:hypothetical protein